ncbi:MAG: MCE family protein [Xanthomonadaceae bacterium]|nr:MCE family protein [Xanthomonadaceae bacterium]
MQTKVESELKVGVFVAVGLGLFMAAVIFLGGATSIFSQVATYHSYFESVDGITPGAKVVLSGIQVGTIAKIEFENDNPKVKISYDINTKFQDRIRKGTHAEVQTQGVLGDKYVSLTPGLNKDPELEAGAEIPTSEGGGIGKFLNDGEKLMASLNSIASNLDKVMASLQKNNRADILFESLAQTSRNMSTMTDHLNKEMEGIKLKSSVKNLNGILEKINNGTGTLGALVNDASLYDDVKSLVGGVNRNRIMRNLVRQTIKDNDNKEADEEKKNKK